MVNDGEPAALFDVPELAMDPHKRGRAEAGLMHALSKAQHLIDEDAGMIGAALVAARALDAAEKFAGPKTPYAIQAAMPALMDALHSLRLPAAVAPDAGPRLPAADAPNTASLLGDLFGTAED